MTATVHGSRALRDPAPRALGGGRGRAGCCWSGWRWRPLASRTTTACSGRSPRAATRSSCSGRFAGAWLVMVAAMMLPTTVPMVRLHGVVTARVDGRVRVRTVFLAAYFAVWLAFAGVALLGDAGVHALVEGWGVAARPRGAAAGWGARAGRCGSVHAAHPALPAGLPRPPRIPVPALPPRRRGRMVARGSRHGASCLGCCWALMLVMFATGAGEPVVDGCADRGHGGREDHPLGAAARGTSRCRAAVRGGLARPGRGACTCGR